MKWKEENNTFTDVNISGIKFSGNLSINFLNYIKTHQSKYEVNLRFNYMLKTLFIENIKPFRFGGKYISISTESVFVECSIIFTC